MSNIALDFQQAKVKHLQFKSNLRSIVYGAADIDENPVLSHFDCKVGKWIYEYALGQYGHLPEMIALENVHAEIHKKAKELVLLYKEGKVMEARNGLNDMEQIAETLVNLLTLLEKKILEHPEKFKNTPDYQPASKTIKELQRLTKTNEELDKIISRQSSELINERKLLRNVFMQLPANIAIFKGKSLILEMVNEPFLNLFGAGYVIGKSASAILPKADNKEIKEILDHIFLTNEPFSKKGSVIKILGKDEQTLEYLMDLHFIPLFNASGFTESIITFYYNVELDNETNKMNSQKEKKRRNQSPGSDDKLMNRNKDLENEIIILKRKIQKLKSAQ